MNVTAGFIGLLALLLLLALQVPVAISMIVVAFFGVWILVGLAPAIGVLANTPYDFIASWTLSAVPMFLPGLLDRVKFTNALVAHAHVAMAGMVSCFLVIVLIALNQGTALAGLFDSRAPFWLWQGGPTRVDNSVVTEKRLFDILPGLVKMGLEEFHLDAGWQRAQDVLLASERSVKRKR